MQRKQQTRGLISALLFLLIFLVPLFLSLGSSGSSSSAPPTQTSLVSPYHATDARIVFDSFAGLAALVLLLSIPVLLFIFDREKKSKMR